MSRNRYVVLIGHAGGNSDSGFHIHYHWDGSYFDRKEDAVTRGFEIAHCDDFNIGVMNNGYLRSLWWMDRDLHERTPVLRSIAEMTGLER